MIGNLFDLTDEDTTKYSLPDKYKHSSCTVVEGRSKVGFVGLFNQGATCYLNSLIQALYMTPELRKGIYDLTKEELGLEEDEKPQREQSPPLPPPKRNEEEDKDEEDEWADQITELIEMGFSRALAVKALRTTKENGNICINRAIEWLFIPGNSDEPSEVLSNGDQINEESNEIAGDDQSNNIENSNDKPKKLRKKRRKIPIELQMLFAELQLADKMSVSTNRLTDSFGWSGKDIGQQHDVHELNRVLFDAIETSLKKTQSESLLNKLYRGSMVNKVQCITCGRVSEREESFQDVTVMVGKMTSLRESLHHFVLPESLDGDNQYYCEKCGEKRDAKRWVCFRQLPPILIFSLSRFEYDFDNDRRIKNCNHFHYPLSIDLAPYHESANSDHTSTSSNVPFESLSPHSIPLFDPSVDSSSSNQLYDLFGVIIHTGNSGEYGHYHAYIKDLCNQGSWDSSTPDREEREEDSEDDEDSIPLDTINSPPPIAPPTTDKGTCKGKKTKEDVDKELEDKKEWYDFNDSNITPIPITRLRKQFGGRNECAYMLIYRNRSSLPPPPPLSVPDHLQDFVATENEIAKNEREEWERLNNQIRIHVYAPDHFFVDEDGIARVLPLDASQSPDSIDTKISFNIDQRLYSSYIKQNIKIMMNEDYLRGCEDPELMQLLPITITKDGVMVARAPISDDQSIQDCSIYNGDQLLVWNGFHLNRSEWNPSNRLISIDLKYISINSDPSIVISASESAPTDENDVINRIPIDISTFQLEIATCTSIRKFKEQLTELISIPVQFQLLSIVIKKIDSFNDFEEQHDIYILHEEEGEEGATTPLTFANYIQYLEGPDVGSHVFLSVERIPDRFADLSLLPPIQRDQKYREISLVEKFLQIQKTRTQLFVIDQISLPHQTLYFLLDKNTTLFELKLRALKQIGSQLDPDQTRLRRTSVNFQGLYQNESVSIDDAGISNFSKVILEEGESPSSRTITIRFRVHPNKDVLTIPVNRSWSVLQMRTTMMEKVGVEGEYLIRRTDFWGHPTTIVDDEKTVGNAGIHPDDLVVLEAGKAPVKGQFLLNLKLFELAYTDDDDGDNDNDDEGGENGKMEVVEESEGKKEGEEKKKRKWELYSPGYVMVKDAPRSYIVTDLNSITISSTATLGELKEVIYQQCGRYLSAPSANHIRVWLRPQIIRNNEKLLRDYYIGNNTSLILQTTPEVDQCKGMKEIALLWVFVRKCKQFAKPIEYLYNNSLRYDKSLFDCISEDFSIPAEHLIVGKYFPSTNSWQIIDADEETPSEPSPNTPSSECSTDDNTPLEETKKKKKGNYYFKDGDIIAVKDKRLDENDEDNFMRQMVTVLPPRAHVQYSYPSAQKRPEAELKIHVDDYDCEYEYDDTPVDQN